MRLWEQACAKFKPQNPWNEEPGVTKPVSGKNVLTFRQVLYALKCDFELERIVERRRIIQHHYIVHLNLCHILKKTQTIGRACSRHTIKSSVLVFLQGTRPRASV